ncbi:hypothetical protein PLESTF_001263600 [Pleodorina starrii]|nr:hypothetical protein PLESTF_001263600 [Pleodorina starrii]
MQFRCSNMRSSRGTAGRRACVCKAQWNVHGNSTRSKSYPPLTYSINRQDVTGAELGMLLAASHTDAMVGPGAIPLCRQYYSYWRSPEGLHHAAKLEVALRRSVACVACFTTWDVYGEAAADQGGGNVVGESQQAPASQSPSGSRRDQERQRDQPQQAWQWQPQEEECALTAAQHERQREQGRARARGSGLPPSSAGSAAASSSPSSSSSPDGGRPAAAVNSSSSSSSSSPFALSSSSSWPSSSSSSSASSASLPRASASQGGLGSKPPPPSGVPDMDWNWLLPSGGSNRSNSGRGGDGDGGGRDSAGGGGSWPSASAQQQHHHQHQWQWPGASSSSSSRAPRRSLIGFARAAGDNSLVATIYDVAVHPAVRGQGIGRRLVKLLVQQVQSRSVYDIGAVTPAATVGFWERCSFDDDREGSTFMTFMGHRPAGRPSGLHLAGGEAVSAATQQHLESYPDFGAPRSPQELLEGAELGFWDAAQRSESLQNLLAAKLQRLKEAEAQAGLRGSVGRWGQAGGDGRVRWGAARSRGVATRSFPE